MALTCSTNVVQYDDFEFIDCTTLSISYNIRGQATVSFTVVSTRKSLLNDYTNLNYGGVSFKGYLTDVSLQKIPGTLVYQFQLNLIAFGC
jgi:hypothetical protein